VQPAEIHKIFEDAFNRGDVDALTALYEPTGVLVLGGQRLVGRDAIRQGLLDVMVPGAQMTLETQSVTESEDGQAILHGKWSIKPGTNGRSTEVVRKQPDGSWLFIMDQPHTAARTLVDIVMSAEPRLLAFDDQTVALIPRPGVWSKKELLGHLIDSASNNHQRFVRLQLADDLHLPKYEQEGWVRVQGYQTSDWLLLLQFWRNYNLHLANVISTATPESLTHTARIGDGEPVTLQFLIDDYLAHLQHHLTELLKPL